MRKSFLSLLLLSLFVLTGWGQAYVPTPENLAERQKFSNFRFGIFIHWGIYSEFAQGEWYLNSGHLLHEEYAKAASCFYPIRFDARQWARAFKDAGARYVTFTSRHHDGFSMWNTQQSDYNIVKATPFRRDVLAELTEALAAEQLQLHLYYSILDWMRPDYPLGRTGHDTGRALQPDYDSYFNFMKKQIRELLCNYRGVKGLWFDGYWDHDSDSIPFDWRMPELYRYIHDLKPECLVGNNHHIAPIEGEDFQMFERDLPGENKAGLSGQDVSTLPLEMCQTMNGMWGYKVADTDYKSVSELVRLIVQAAAKNCNLLLNIGPQPNGELPALALDRLKGIGQWMRHSGESVYETTATDLPLQPWGVTTQRPGRLFLHVFDAEAGSVSLPMAKRPRMVKALNGGQQLPYSYDKRRRQLTVSVPENADSIDFVIEVNP